MTDINALTAEQVTTTFDVLGESPVWDEPTGTLWWIDIIGRRVHGLQPETADRRSLEIDVVPGAIAVIDEHRLIVAHDGGFGSLDLETGALEPVADCVPAALRMNDGKCDPAGRFWAGTCRTGRDAPPGALFVLDPDGSVTTALDDVVVSNGLAWSPDERSFYYIDTFRRSIDRFDYDVDTGAIRNRSVLVTFDKTEIPDGMTVDAEGCLWVAMWQGSRVLRYSPDGSPLGVLTVPVRNPSSCAFGGPGLGDLYVTSAATPDGSRADDLHAPPAGAVFRFRSPTAGLPMRRYG